MRPGSWGSVFAAGLPRTSAHLPGWADGDDRLFGQQQGRRLSDRPTGRCTRPRSRLPRVCRRARHRADPVPRARRDDRARRRPGQPAIRAQPGGTVAGRFRLTEQGEIIAARYSNLDMAHPPPRPDRQRRAAGLRPGVPGPDRAYSARLRAARIAGGTAEPWRAAMEGMSACRAMVIPPVWSMRRPALSTSGRRPHRLERSSACTLARARRRAGRARRGGRPRSAPSPGCSPGCRAASTCPAGMG